MKFRGLKHLIIAGLILAAAPVPAFADDGGMSFGVEEVKEKPLGPSPVAGLLAEGKKLYGAQKYLEAAQKFFAVTQNNSPAAQIDKNEAQYQLARTLYRLKLYQSALTYYRTVTDVGETHPFYLPALNGLLELSEVIPEDSQLNIMLAGYAKFFPNDIPKRYTSQFGYLAGRTMDQSEPELAVKLLSSVSQASPEYAKAQYIAGVANASAYDAKAAADNFKNSLRVLTKKRNAGTITDDEKRLLELGYLALARIFYSTGQFKTSVKYYSKIDRRSENWPVALFESAWAYFQLDNYNTALGNLQSVNSPFFSDRYFPEGPILSAVLYFYNCRYDRVRSILDDFAYEYEPLQQDVQKLVDKYGQDFGGAYQWLINARTKGVENPQLERVVSAALSDKQVRDKLRLLIDIDKELKTLSELPDTFKNSPAGKHLEDANKANRTNTTFDIGELAVSRLDRVNRELQDLIIEQKKILFEVDRSERGEIEAELRAELAASSKNDVKEYKVKTTSEQLVWVFDGEYWRDELGYYVVTTTSSCRR